MLIGGIHKETLAQRPTVIADGDHLVIVVKRVVGQFDPDLGEQSNRCCGQRNVDDGAASDALERGTDHGGSGSSEHERVGGQSG